MNDNKEFHYPPCKQDKLTCNCAGKLNMLKQFLESEWDISAFMKRWEELNRKQ